MSNKTKVQLASERIEEDTKRFLASGNKIKELNHDEFGLDFTAKIETYGVFSNAEIANIESTES